MSETVANARKDPANAEIVDRYFRKKACWVQLMKDLRGAYGVSLHEAQRMALSHDGWRRWAEQRVKIDPKCRKQVLADTRRNGAVSLIERRGDQLLIR